MSREKIVAKSLGPEDERQKSFEGRLDGAYGMIFMSNRKLIFVSEKGIFSKSYNLVLDLAYEKIKGLRTEGNYNLIIEAEDLKHTFKPVTSARIVEEAIRELMEKEPSHVI